MSVETLKLHVTRAGALLVERQGDVPRLLGRAPQGAPSGVYVVPYRGGNIDLRALLVPRPTPPTSEQVAEALLANAVPGVCVGCGSAAPHGLFCDWCRTGAARKELP